MNTRPKDTYTIDLKSYAYAGGYTLYDGARSAMRTFTWRAVSFTTSETGAKTFRERLGVLWGFDIWIDGFPLLKLLVLANAVSVALMWVVRP